MKITDHKSLINVLKSNNFVLIKSNGHETWQNRDDSSKKAVIPHRHNGSFNRMMAQRIVKQAGISLK
jgi:predicted RNA binding protein YcfA (HicA-like mRNA interferase family)